MSCTARRVIRHPFAAWLCQRRLEFHEDLPCRAEGINLGPAGVNPLHHYM